MQKLILAMSMGVLLVGMQPASAEPKNIEKYAQHVKTLSVKTPQKAAPTQPKPEEAFGKPIVQPMKRNDPVEKDIAVKKIEPVKTPAMQTQPHGNVTPHKDSAKPKPDVKPHKDTSKPKPEVRPEKKHEKHNPPQAHHDKNPHRPQPLPPAVKHHKPQPVVKKYYISSPTVTYVSTGNSGIVYEANPHIYTPSAYHCSYQGDLKYCTDYRGYALTGRIVQKYEDTVAYENYKKGYLSGETSVYSLDGVLLQTTNYSKGVKHGKEVVYYSNGHEYYSVNYSKGKLNGNVREYDTNGMLLGEMTYVNGHYKYRYCRNDTTNALKRERIKANMLNDLVLCSEF